MRADDPATLDGDLRVLGMVLNLPVQTADAPTARQMVLSWLNGAAQRWLLLYDNADRMSGRDLRPCLPGGRGHVLITSRRPHWPGTRRLRLDVFTVEEAMAFLLVRSAHFSAPKPAEAGTTNEEAELLAEELGYLPLALEQAAAYMEKRQKSAAQYLALYQEQRQELWARARPDDYEKTVTTTWEMAFDHARQTPGAADLLNLCCFLAPDDIPLELITAQAAAVVGDEMAQDDALEALQDYSLVAQTGETLAMHRLVQTVARDRMGEERRRIWAEVTLNLLYKVYNFDPQNIISWIGAGQLIPHLITVTDQAATEEIINHCSGKLNNAIGAYLNRYGQLKEAHPFFERALSITEKVHGPNQPETAAVIHNLAGLYWDMGKLNQAKTYLERALAIDENSEKIDSLDTAKTLNALGVVLQDLGDYEAARPAVPGTRPGHLRGQIRARPSPYQNRAR